MVGANNKIGCFSQFKSVTFEWHNLTHIWHIFIYMYTTLLYKTKHIYTHYKVVFHDLSQLVINKMMPQPFTDWGATSLPKKHPWQPARSRWTHVFPPSKADIVYGARLGHQASFSAHRCSVAQCQPGQLRNDMYCSFQLLQGESYCVLSPCVKLSWWCHTSI